MSFTAQSSTLVALKNLNMKSDIAKDALSYGVDLKDDSIGDRALEFVYDRKDDIFFPEAITIWQMFLPFCVMQNWAELDFYERSIAFLSAVSACRTAESIYDRLVARVNRC